LIPKKIIALSGIKRSGKDSVASILIAKGYSHFKFADYLATLVTEMVGKDIAKIYSQDAFKEILIVGHRKSWRELMIEIGARERAKDAKVFVNTTIKAINNSKNPLIVISDVRMTNELDGLHKAFPGEQVSFIWVDRYSCHINPNIPTENGECKPFAEHIIQNNGSREDLAIAVNSLLQKISVTQ
jgi:dephospho-CoA kinase